VHHEGDTGALVVASISRALIPNPVFLCVVYNGQVCVVTGLIGAPSFLLLFNVSILSFLHPQLNVPNPVFLCVVYNGQVCVVTGLIGAPSFLLLFNVSILSSPHPQLNVTKTTYVYKLHSIYIN
jgi:hypothetical protein